MMVYSVRDIATTLLAAAPLVWSPPAAASAPGSTGAPPEAVALDCDTGLLEDELGERVQAKLVAALEPVIAELGLRLEHESESGAGVVRVRVVAYDEQRQVYELRVAVDSDGDTPPLPTIRCEGCSEEQLVALVVERIEPLLGSLVVEPEPPPPPAIELAEAPLVGDEPRQASRGASFGGLGIGGAMMLGVGASALAAGGYLLGRGFERDLDIDGARIQTVDYRPAGAAVVAVGAVVTSVGAALLAVNLRRRTARNGRLGVVWTPTLVGVHVGQRF